MRYSDGGDDEGQQIFVAQVEAQAYSSLGPWLQVRRALCVLLGEDIPKFRIRIYSEKKIR